MKSSVNLSSAVVDHVKLARPFDVALADLIIAMPSKPCLGNSYWLRCCLPLWAKPACRKCLWCLIFASAPETSPDWAQHLRWMKSEPFQVGSAWLPIFSWHIYALILSKEQSVGQRWQSQRLPTLTPSFNENYYIYCFQVFHFQFTVSYIPSRLCIIFIDFRLNFQSFYTGVNGHCYYNYV